MKSNNKWSSVVFMVLVLIGDLMYGGCAAEPMSQLAVNGLSCEYQNNPPAINTTQPRLSWVIQSSLRTQKQTAYQILVASSREKLDADKADIWNSGKIKSDKSVYVDYNGPELKSRQQFYWKVRVWDKNNKAAPYSKPAQSQIGLLGDCDWQGKWISAPRVYDIAKFIGNKRHKLKQKWYDRSLMVDAAPVFRKSFSVKKPVKKARIYVSGLGYHELYLNGEKLGDNVLDPAFTRYDKTALYVTHNVTDRLIQGKNAIGAILGNGWYNMHTAAIWCFDKAPWRARPTLLCQLEIEYEDGSRQTISTDKNWKVIDGPIIFDSVRNGETYDARREIPRWNTADFDDSKWFEPLETAGPAGKLTAQTIEPIKITRTIKPVKMTEPNEGVYVFDMGQNIAGWVQLNVSGPAGTEVELKYSERIYEDGTIDERDVSRFIFQWQPQTDSYILKGKGVESWQPRFAYHGFQYVQITGFPGKPTLDSIIGKVVHTSFESAGKFSCSNDILNKIQQNTRWSYISNFHGYPTDCPHREKNGWTGDASLAAETGLYNFAASSAYAKWMGDFRDEMKPTGELPGIVPTGGWGYYWGNGPAWDSAGVLIPWYMYLYNGDERILARQYEYIKRYVDYLTGKSQHHIVSIGLGDWLPPKTETPAQITSTGYYYCDTVILSRIAAILGKDKQADKYEKLAGEIKKAFNDEFFDAAKQQYKPRTQAAVSCALYQGLIEEKNRKHVLDDLVSLIKENDNLIDAGILGAKYLLNTLTENGLHHLAYQLATEKRYPSWGWWIDQGATTLWETWDGKGGSLNHIMFGDISAWMYKNLAGINPDINQPGFRHIIIRPRPVDDLEWVKAEHETMYGTIKSNWKIENKTFQLDITIPVNTTATVYVPAVEAKSVTESSKPATEADGVEYIKFEDKTAVFKTGSGSYSFTSRYKL